MSQVQLSRSEKPWAIGALLTLGIILMGFVLSLPVLFLSLLFQPFNIPAGSMMPTFLAGDYFFVSKYAYGYSRYTWPFSSAPFVGRVWGSEPARGDVIAFLLKDNSTVYIKRLVGLPGDRIQMRDGLLNINGVPVARERLPDFVSIDPCGSGGLTKTKRWRETLPNGVSYETLDCVDNGFYDNTNVYTVPSGHFFVLGDNRDNSTDSRVLSAIGYVPLENLVGRAGMIFFSMGRDPAGTGSKVRFERIGSMVR
ncbi:signal peptidase I [Bradyrhizobium sp.]|uniref:signal peptidase I n=1 Tax=Bradyrhizobium sp. TaxID=376 RepID=UPI003C3B0357